MRLSAKKVQYACAALFELALEYDSGQPLQVHAIAQRQNVPTNYLMQILITLRRAGMVVSVRGAQGGYRLALSPEKISLAQIIRVVDGPFHDDLPDLSGGNQRLACFWLSRLQYSACDAVEKQMEAITIADLVDRYGCQHEPMYCI